MCDKRRGGQRCEGNGSAKKIIGILKEAEAGVALGDLTREYVICEGTYYRWKAKYGGLELSDAKQLRHLEQENMRLKRLLADALLDKQILQKRPCAIFDSARRAA
jgi:putative transposase